MSQLASERREESNEFGGELLWLPFLAKEIICGKGIAKLSEAWVWSGLSTRVDMLLYNRLNIDPAVAEFVVWVVARHILYDTVHIASPICSSKTYNLLRNFEVQIHP